MIDRFIEVDSSRLCLVNVSGPGAGEPLAPVPPVRRAVTNGHVGELTDEARPYTLSASEKRNADRDTRELNKVRPQQPDGLGDINHDINTSRWQHIEILVRRDLGTSPSAGGSYPRRIHNHVGEALGPKWAERQRRYVFGRQLGETERA
jgi:hypothetical protein